MNWWEAIPYVKLALRSTVNTTTKYSPFEIVRGGKLRLPSTHI